MARGSRGARMVGKEQGHVYVTFDDDKDVVLERGARAVAGIEVKASATVTSSDFRGLRKLKDATGNRFAAGVVLYDGEAVVGFGDRLFAVPIQALWEGSSAR